MPKYEVSVPEEVEDPGKRIGSSLSHHSTKTNQGPHEQVSAELAYRRADAWARSPEGTPYGEVAP